MKPELKLDFQTVKTKTKLKTVFLQLLLTEVNLGAVMKEIKKK